jgi:hypothetical protein
VALLEENQAGRTWFLLSCADFEASKLNIMPYENKNFALRSYLHRGLASALHGAMPEEFVSLGNALGLLQEQVGLDCPFGTLG